MTGSGPSCTFCVAPVDLGVVQSSRKVVAARLNPNAPRLRGRFPEGPEMVRFLDALGREVDRTASTSPATLRAKIDEVAARFEPAPIPWSTDLAAAIEKAAKEKKLVAALAWTRELDEDKRWKESGEIRAGGAYLGDFVFVKAALPEAYGTAAPGTLLILDPARKDFEKKPLLAQKGPFKPKPLTGWLVGVLAKPR